jgi:folate-binding protein YgfZ
MAASPLQERQRSQGAVFPEADRSPLHFGDPGVEARAARESAALFDLCGWTQIELSGADRKSFLHNFCTNDINALSPGTGCEAFLTNIKGRILGHILVSAGTDELRLVSVPGAAAGILSHLDRYLISEDAELRDLTPETATLSLTGPLASGILSHLFDVRPDDLEMLSRTRASLSRHSTEERSGRGAEEMEVEIVRVPLAPQPAFLLSVRADSVADLWQLLTDSNATPAGSEVFNALRIAAGFPLCGVDISEENIAQEAGRTRQAISFTKGCYLGQEPIARLDALGHVNRLLCHMRLGPLEPIPTRGTTVLDESGDQEIGSITSTAIDYPAGDVVALAMLKAAFTAADTPVSIRTVDDVLVTGSVTGESGVVHG